MNVGSNIDQAKEELGELFMTGIEGTTLSDDSSAFLSQAGIGGVLLFTQNYKDPDQLWQLTQSIQDCRRDSKLWIAVDQEGGRVQRFKDPFSRLPTGAQVGRIDSPKLAFELGELMARELRSVGINVNFAPVADILTNPANPVIGDRAFGSDEAVVTKLVTAIVRGHVTQGVQPCVKHFPGHGDTSEDSHFALPSVETDVKTLESREWRPFVRSFKSRCSMVMIAHVIHRGLDPKFPATLSPTILKTHLREQMRYSKIIISDDLEMQAITDHFAADKAPLLALQAGCDLLIYRTEAAARKAYQVCQHALEDGSLDPAIVIESAARIRDVKTEVLVDEEPARGAWKEILNSEQHKALLAEFAEKKST